MALGHNPHHVPEWLILILIQMSYDKLVLVPVSDRLHPGRLRTALEPCW